MGLRGYFSEDSFWDAQTVSPQPPLWAFSVARTNLAAVDPAGSLHPSRWQAAATTAVSTMPLYVVPGHQPHADLMGLAIESEGCQVMKELWGRPCWFEHQAIYPEMHLPHSSRCLCESRQGSPVLSPIALESSFQCRNASNLLSGISKPDPAGNKIYWTNNGMETVKDELPSKIFPSTTRKTHSWTSFSFQKPLHSRRGNSSSVIRRIQHNVGPTNAGSVTLQAGLAEQLSPCTVAWGVCRAKSPSCHPDPRWDAQVPTCWGRCSFLWLSLQFYVYPIHPLVFPKPQHGQQWCIGRTMILTPFLGISSSNRNIFFFFPLPFIIFFSPGPQVEPSCCKMHSCLIS